MEPLEEEVCPLITPYTDKLGVPHKTLDLLYRVRQHDPEEGPIPITYPPTVRSTMKNGKELKIRNYQTQSIAHFIKMPRHIDGHGVGLGKAQPLSAKVLTPYGWTTMGQLKIGDEIVDPDGGTGVVEAIFPQGSKPIFKFEMMDGSFTECCEDHLWHVYTMADKMRETGGRVLSTKDLINLGLSKKNKGWRRSKFFLPVAQPSCFNSNNDLPIPPYLLGALIGDGGLSKISISLTSADKEIIDRVKLELPDNLELKTTSGKYGFRISSGRKVSNKNSILESLRNLDLMGHKSNTKFIPINYLLSSIDDRKLLLQGLLDTDGECSKDGLVYYHTSSYKLAGDIAELVRSLGGLATISKPRKRFFVYKGVKKQGLDSYYISIRTSFNPFFLERKKSRWKPPIMSNAIKSIKPLNTQPAQCIKVSSKRNLYITDNYIVTHNTLMAIVASACKIAKNPNLKVIVMGTKSTTYQWKGEYENFTSLNVEVLQDTYKKMKGSEARLAQIEDFLKSKTQNVLICKYTSLVGRRRTIDGEFDQDGNPISRGQKEEVSPEVQALIDLMKVYGQNVVLVCDEAQKFKSTTSQIRRMILKLQPHISVIWAMTATIIQNSLEEMYSISCAIGIRPFGAMALFRDRFCIYKQVHVGRGIMKDVLVGYRNVREFKIGMRPFYYGRSQAQVKEPLPKLTTVYHPVDLDKKQAKLLLEDIPNGKFILPPSIRKKGGELYEKERDVNNMMTQLSVFQLVANHPSLLDPANKTEFYTKKLSPKEEMLLELLEGDLEGEKVIVFTKSRSWIDRFEKLFEMGCFGDRKFLRITGAENEKERDIVKKLFQENPDYTLLFINSAASEGVNLQQAAHMVMLDAPWSWGQLLQTVGRMVRMASPHSACSLHIILARGTIDEYAIEVLKGKGQLFEIILGESYSAGVLTEDGNDLDLASGMEKLNDDEEFKKLLKAHVKTTKMGDFLNGSMLEEAQDQDGYKMAFEKGGKGSKKSVTIKEELDFSKWSF